MNVLVTVLRRIWLPIVLITIWWFASARSTSPYFPPLQLILERFVADWFGPGFVEHAVPSIAKFATGFLLAGILGVLVGVVIGTMPWLRAAVDPLIQFLRALPPPALLPIGIVLFGITWQMNIFIIVIGAVWPTLINTADAVRSVDQGLIDMARSYRLSGWRRLTNVILPSAGPQIAAGLRTTLQISIILIVVSEMFAASSGIGFRVLEAQSFFDVLGTWSGTLILALLGTVATALFVLVERSVLRWQYGMRRASGAA